MTIFTTLFATTTMLLLTLVIGALSLRSVCASLRWKQEVIRVGETLKSHPSLRFTTKPCHGPRIAWPFKGDLHE